MTALVVGLVLLTVPAAVKWGARFTIRVSVLLSPRGTRAENEVEWLAEWLDRREPRVRRLAWLLCLPGSAFGLHVQMRRNHVSPRTMSWMIVHAFSATCSLPLAFLETYCRWGVIDFLGASVLLGLFEATVLLMFAYRAVTRFPQSRSALLVRANLGKHERTLARWDRAAKKMQPPQRE